MTFYVFEKHFYIPNCAPPFLNILRLISIFATLNTVFKQRVMSTQNFIIARWSVSIPDVIFLWFHTAFFLHCFLKLLKHYDDVKSKGRHKWQNTKLFQQGFIYSSLQIYFLISAIVIVYRSVRCFSNAKYRYW